MIKTELQNAIRKALKELGVEDAVVALEHPADVTHGDYATNAAFQYAKSLHKSPKELAEVIVRYIVPQQLNDVEKVTVAGSGFINFYFSQDFFASAIKEVGNDFGKNTELAGKLVMVEYTDPNPFKEFHIGHLMSNAIGESLARLFEYRGAKVVRACWQGDVGLHVAKAIWGAKKLNIKNQNAKIEEWGRAYALGSEKYETDASAKAEIETLNKKIFDRSEAEVNTLYDAGRAVSLKHFEEIYNVLGTKFDYHFFESKEGLAGVPLVEKGLNEGVFERSEGAIVYKGEKKGLHTRVFINSQGLPTYEAKELGLNSAKFKAKPALDLSVIVTANEQSDYFKVVLAAMEEVLPDIAKRTKHVAHGMLRFATGKMSSRKGNVITGESLILQVKELVQEKLKEREMSAEEKDRVAELVALGAVKYSIVRQTTGADISFDFEKSISFEGDSGPYLQYSAVRASSVLQKAKQEKVVPNAALPQGWNTTPLERWFYRFPEVVSRAGRELEPHYIATYLIELAAAFNSWYAKEQIVAKEDPASPYKIALTAAFEQTMHNGLWLLGIETPDRM